MVVRFLTPSKIILLALAVVYCERSVPTVSIPAVLDVILRNILPDLDDQHQHQHQQRLLSLSTGETGEDQQQLGTLTISQLENVLTSLDSTVPGRTIWDLLVKKLWSMDCLAALDAFVDMLPSLLVKSREQLIRERDSGEVAEHGVAAKVVRTSPLGYFIRKCHLEHARLPFQDGIELWEDFIRCRYPTRAVYEQKNPSDDRSARDINLSDLNIDASHPLAQIMYARLDARDEEQMSSVPVWSRHDVEQLLEFQMSEMQRLGGRLPEAMKKRLDHMSKAGKKQHNLSHYLKYLDSWRAGDFASAFDNLHRYFDYTMQTRDRIFYQYALLNLAILHADFGCYNEAIPAIQEAIATARENKDTVCLNFCMSWFYHFARSSPTHMTEIREKGMLGGEAEGLQFLKSRARDAEMWSLLSSTLLGEAKLGLQHGDSIAMVFENIVKAAHINNIKGVPSASGPALLMKASVFGRIGQSHMASLCGETFIECHHRTAALEDILRCSCRLASLFAQHGRYGDMETVMEGVPNSVHRVLKYHNYWAYFNNTLKLRRLLHHNRLDAAWLVLKHLKAQDAPETELQSNLLLLEIDYLIRTGELDVALCRVDELAERSQNENNDVMVRVKSLTLKARLLAKAGKPLKGFSLTTRAASMAYNARVLPALWEAINALSTILIVLQEFEATRSLLEAILPRVLECEDCDLAAQTHSLLADVFMGLAGSASGFGEGGFDDDNNVQLSNPKIADNEDVSSTISTDREDSVKEYTNLAMNHIELAFEQWTLIEDMAGQLDCLSKKASLQSWQGDSLVADDTASQFLELREKYIAMEADGVNFADQE